MTEKVGNVILDLEYYPGEDLYCDGEVEDELLSIVQNYGQEEFQRIIEEKNSWPILYHLSKQRANIIEWLPSDSGSKVLEIGAGCGAISGTLAKKCGQLTCVDLSKKRSLINAYRNRECNNITIKVGNFQDIEPALDTDYDMICLIGVFEYAAAYIAAENPYTAFLNIVRKHLAPNGKIVIAIENRFGLKYFSGCKEDHLGNYFSGIEDYPDGGVVRTFTRQGLEKICQSCGITRYSFYYPYPDYKFMHTLYSDKRLPKEGELTTNLRNFDRDRLLLFDEKSAFDSIIRDGNFPLFANSYLLLIGKEEDCIYTKYSNDRADKYAIRTDIKQKSESIWVEKHPLSESAKAHIEGICEAGVLLQDRYKGSNLQICPGKMQAGVLQFPFLEGETLENKMDKCLENQDMEGFIILWKEYFERISFGENCRITDYDLIFPNIMVSEHKNWTVIDYEWTRKEMISSKEIALRALYCYFLGSEKRKSLPIQRLLKEIGVESWDEEKLNQDEIKFQKRVTGERLSLSQMRDSIHYEVLPLTDAIMREQNKEREKLVQIYPDTGAGYSEDTSYFIMPEGTKEENIIRIKLKDDVLRLRVDPCMYSSLFSWKKIRLWDEKGNEHCFPDKKISHNGTMVGKNTLVFSHSDPNIVFDRKYMKKGTEITELEISYELVPVSQTIAEKMTMKK